MSEIENVVIVHFDTDGNQTYHVCGERMQLFIVDERTPHDRVYEWLPRCDATVIREVIPQGSEIGSSEDERHTAIAAAVEAHSEGRPHLRVVEAEA